MDKKELVLEVLAELINKNGKTTTLEVKNEAHARNNAAGGTLFAELRQSEVSQIISDFYRDQDDENFPGFDPDAITLERNLFDAGNGLKYFEYYFESVNSASNVPFLSGTPALASVAQTNGTRQPAAQPAVAIGLVSAVDKTAVDKNLYVAFVAGNPADAILYDTSNKYAARAGLKKDKSAVHETVRMMKLKRFENKY